MNKTAIPVVTAEQTAAILEHIDVVAAMRRVFTRLADGQAVQPAQQMVLLPDGKGDVIHYFGVDMSRRQLGAKISPYLVTEKDPVITAWTLLMSTETGLPLMLCDASLLTVARTAATTALAVDLLAAPSAQTLTLIGTGAVGRAHLRYALPLRSWQTIRIYSRSGAEETRAWAASLGLPEGRVEVCSSVEEAISACDVLMLCTSSATPVIDVAALTRPCLITSISTNAPGAHEVSPNMLSGMAVYCDYRQTTPFQAGEMVMAARDGGWSPESICADLPELVTAGRVTPSDGRHRYFRSLGLGLEDIALADGILTHLREQE